MTIFDSMRLFIKFLGIITFVFYIFNYASISRCYAAHPLVSDDTGTQGKGKFLFEFNGQLSRDKADSLNDTGVNETTKKKEHEVKAAVTGGISDDVDVILSVPYQWKKTEINSAIESDLNGIADISLEVKWRFFERDGLGLAFKPGITLPTGDKDKDIGTGRATGALFFIATKEMTPWAFHLNLGYKRNKNRLDQEEDIWHASLAGELKVIQGLKLVANIGTERNTDKSSQTNPTFILGGFIYSLKENLDVDLGVKVGLNETEKDYSFLGGIALRF